MATAFKPAERKKLWLRMAFCGPPKSGKSHNMLRAAHALQQRMAADGMSTRIAAIDTEFGSLSKYAAETYDNITWQFDVCPLEHFSPTAYTAMIGEAAKAGYRILIIDSLSHAWTGIGGALQMVDDAAAAGNGNKFTTGWRNVTPKHNEMVDAILAYPGHVFVSMRTQVEYVLEEVNGKKVPRKVGTKPVQRAGMEYEFDVVAEVDQDHIVSIHETRCSAVDGKSWKKPSGSDIIVPIAEWLEIGAPREERPSPFTPPAGSSTATECRPDVDPCTADQQAHIKDLAVRLKMPREALVAAIQKRGATKLAELTIANADNLISSLMLKEAGGRF